MCQHKSVNRSFQTAYPTPETNRLPCVIGRTQECARRNATSVMLQNALFRACLRMYSIDSWKKYPE